MLSLNPKPLREQLRENIVSWLEPADPGSKGQQYVFYGNNRVLFDLRDQEIMLSGPADTGKTLACLCYLNRLCWQYPGAQMAIIRKQYATLPGSALQTYQRKVIRPEDKIIIYGGEQRASQYIYPNGSVIWVGGMDKASKVLSSERDVIYVNQAEELTQPEWEHLVSRASGRAGNMPYSMVIGDCNPSSPTHWIRSRARSGALVLLETTHRDNPEIYSPVTGELTPEGERRLAALERLTGTTRQRLLYGLWTAPEGVIFDCFDERTHRVSTMALPRTWARVVGVDPYGAYTAAVWLAFDPQNSRLYVYREYYQPFGLTTRQHVKNILALSGYSEHGAPTGDAEPVLAWVGGGPSENQIRIDWAEAGIPLLENEVTDVWSQIDRVIQLLQENSLLIMDCCVNLLSEIGSYRRKVVAGQVTNQIEDKDNYHLLDALRYAVAWLTTPVEKQRVGRVTLRIGDY